MLDWLRRCSQGSAHLLLLYPSFGFLRSFRLMVCEIPTPLSSPAQSGQRAELVSTCPGFEAASSSSGSSMWSDPANSRPLQC